MSAKVLNHSVELNLQKWKHIYLTAALYKVSTQIAKDSTRPSKSFIYSVTLQFVIVVGVDRGEGFNLGLGEKSNEVSIQKHREADKFRFYAPNPQSQSNPVLELDEFYCKDEKVPKIDLETFAKDHNKEKEG